MALEARASFSPESGEGTGEGSPLFCFSRKKGGRGGSSTREEEGVQEAPEGRFGGGDCSRAKSLGDSAMRGASSGGAGMCRPLSDM